MSSPTHNHATTVAKRVGAALCAFLAAGALLAGCPDEAAAPTDTVDPAGSADITAPAEIALAAGPGLDNSSVILSWSEPADADFSHASISWTPVGGTPAQPLHMKKGKQTATVTGLSSGTYTFTAVSVDLAGNKSAAGDASTSSYTINTSAPAVPVLTVNATANAGATVAWSDPVDEDFAHVIIHWTPEGGDLEQPLRVERGAETIAIAGFEDGTTYTFTAVSVDSEENASAASAGAPVVADATPPATVALAITPRPNATAELTWSDPDDDDFSHALINWTPEGGAVEQPLRAPRGAQTAAVTGLTDGATYAFTAVSVDNAGNESASGAAASILVDATPPAQVSALTVTQTDDTTAVLTWGDPADNDFSHVFVAWTAGGAGGARPMRVDKDAQTATVAGLATGTSYTFSVESVDDSNNLSAAVSSDPFLMADITPQVSAFRGFAKSSGGSLQVHWTDPSGDDLEKVIISYRVGSGAAATVEVDIGVQTATLTRLTNGSTYLVTATTVDNADKRSNPTAELSIAVDPYMAIWSLGSKQGNFGFDACANFLRDDTGALAVNLRSRGVAKAKFFGSTGTYNFGEMATKAAALPGSGSRKMRTVVQSDSAITETAFGTTFAKVVEQFGITTAFTSFWAFTRGNWNKPASYIASHSCNHATSNSGSVYGFAGNSRGVSGAVAYYNRWIWFCNNKNGVEHHGRTGIDVRDIQVFCVGY